MKDEMESLWMQQYQTGEMGAFDKLYAAFGPRIYGYLKKRLRDPNEVDDVFQKVFMKLHQSRHLYDPKFQVAPWIFVLCKNALNDHLRATRTQTTLTDHMDPDLFAAPSASSPIDTSALSPNEKDAITLRYTNDLEFAEIAKTLSTTPTNVRKIISRAIKKLRSQ